MRDTCDHVVHRFAAFGPLLIGDCVDQHMSCSLRKIRKKWKLLLTGAEIVSLKPIQIGAKPCAWRNKVQQLENRSSLPGQPILLSQDFRLLQTEFASQAWVFRDAQLNESSNGVVVSLL